MADEKYIVFAGFRIPIDLEADVLNYHNTEAPNFYFPQKHVPPPILKRGLELQAQGKYGIENELYVEAEATEEEKEKTETTSEPQPSPPTPKYLRLFGFRRHPRVPLTRLPFKAPGLKPFDRSKEHLAGFRALREVVRQIVIHTDGNLDSTGAFYSLVANRLSCHFLINHDGTLYQPLDIYHMSWAAGVNNGMAINIVLNNPMKLELSSQDPADPKRKNFRRIINGKMRVALGFTEAQYKTLIALIKVLIRPVLTSSGKGWTPLPKISDHCFPPFDKSGKVFDRAIAPQDRRKYVGLLAHWHTHPKQWDPGPGFLWKKVVEGIHGHRCELPIRLPFMSRAIRQVNGVNASPIFDAYYRYIEKNPHGGWYPMGPHQTWHSGVHIRIGYGSPVYAMLEGEVIAFRNQPYVERGSANFVLMRHSLPTENKDDPPRILYTLYMHLEELRTNERIGQIPWLTSLLQGRTVPMNRRAFPNDARFAPKNMPPKVFDARDVENPKAIVQPLLDGKIIISSVRVKTGEVIGFSGRFGMPPHSLPQIHVEAFSPENIFPDEAIAERPYWILVEGDLDDDSLANVTSLLREMSKAIQPEARLLEIHERYFKPKEIEAFYHKESNLGARRRLRRSITYHISEWSTRTDWTATATTAVGWQWETQEAFSDWLWTWVPFRWLNQEVSELLGFEDHHFYFYHPVSLVQYLNSAYTGLGAMAWAASEAELRRLIAKKARNEMTPKEQRRYEKILAERRRRMGDALSAYAEREPGEWEAP